MNSNLKSALLSVLAAVFLLAGSGANASAAFSDPAGVSRSRPAVFVPQGELADPPCNLAPLMKLTGAGSRSHSGRRNEIPRSPPAMTEPSVFVKNPFLSTAP
jgi:hypothetical protein